MAENTVVEYCAINVAANPHPTGVYESILRSAALNPVRYWGDHHATISEPVEIEDGYFQGRLVAWTEINKNEPAVNLEMLTEIDLSDLDIQLPDNIGFNGRIFFYTFREKDHKLFVEVKNEFGKRLSPHRVEKIFSLLLSPEILGVDAPLVETTLMPDEDTLDRILTLHRLKRLDIHIVRPNADDVDVREILEELEAQGAKSMDKTLIAAPQNDGLIPDENTSKQAHVAAYNGYVSGSGRQEDGEAIDLSTKAHPRIFDRLLTEFGSALGAALLVAKESRFGHQRR